MQQALHLKWDCNLSFDTYFAPAQSPQAERVQALKSFISKEQRQLGPMAYLYGPLGSGATHLLKACCYERHSLGHPVAYLQCSSDDEGALLEGMECLDLVAIDQPENWVGHPRLEQALFHALNRCMEQNTSILLASRALPLSWPWSLPDLQSRLAASLYFKLSSYSEQESVEILCFRAGLRGLLMSQEVGHYLLKHLNRDMHSLMQALSSLDQAALRQQRHLTIPFSKEVLHL